MAAMPGKMSSALWYLFAAILLVALVGVFLSQPQGVLIPYSDFKALLLAGKVTEATIGQDSIRATVNLAGAERLLPPAEYLAIQQPPTAGQSFGLPLGGPTPPAPARKPAPSPTPVPSSASPAASAGPAAAAPDLHSIETRRVDDAQLDLAAAGGARTLLGGAAERVARGRCSPGCCRSVVLIAVWNLMLRKGGGARVRRP